MRRVLIFIGAVFALMCSVIAALWLPHRYAAEYQCLVFNTYGQDSWLLDTVTGARMADPSVFLRTNVVAEAISPDKKYRAVLIKAANGNQRLNVTELSSQRLIMDEPAEARTLLWTADSQRVIVQQWNNQDGVWVVKSLSVTGQPEGQFANPKFIGISGLYDFSPNNDYYFILSDAGTEHIEFWSTTTFERMQVDLPAGFTQLTHMAWSPNEKRLAYALGRNDSRGAKAQIALLDTHQQIALDFGPAAKIHLLWSLDGQYLAVRRALFDWRFSVTVLRFDALGNMTRLIDIDNLQETSPSLGEFGFTWTTDNTLLYIGADQDGQHLYQYRPEAPSPTILIDQLDLRNQSGSSIMYSQVNQRLATTIQQEDGLAVQVMRGDGSSSVEVVSGAQQVHLVLWVLHEQTLVINWQDAKDQWWLTWANPDGRNSQSIPVLSAIAPPFVFQSSLFFPVTDPQTSHWRLLWFSPTRAELRDLFDDLVNLYPAKVTEDMVSLWWRTSTQQGMVAYDDNGQLVYLFDMQGQRYTNELFVAPNHQRGIVQSTLNNDAILELVRHNEPSQILMHNAAQLMLAVWSPDSQKVAILLMAGQISDNQIVIYSADGALQVIYQEVRQLTFQDVQWTTCAPHR